MSKVIEVESLRVTVLTTKLVRIEYSPTRVFEDRFTQLVQNREFEPCEVTVLQPSPQHMLEVVTMAEIP